MSKEDGHPENRLITLAAQGDKHAFGVLYTRYLDEIFRYVAYKLDDQAVAEDITEETFIKTWQYLPKIYKNGHTINNLRAWLYRTANNLVIDIYRKKKPADIIKDLPPNKDSLPESILEERDSSKHIIEAIKKLPPDDQEIIILRFINELSHQQTATILGISEGRSRILQYRALKKLKEIMQNEEKPYA